MEPVSRRWAVYSRRDPGCPEVFRRLSDETRNPVQVHSPPRGFAARATAGGELGRLSVVVAPVPAAADRRRAAGARVGGRRSRRAPEVACRAEIVPSAATRSVSGRRPRRCPRRRESHRRRTASGADPPPGSAANRRGGRRESPACRRSGRGAAADRRGRGARPAGGGSPCQTTGTSGSVQPARTGQPAPSRRPRVSASGRPTTDG